MTIDEDRTEVRQYFERYTLDALDTEGRPGHYTAMHGRAVPYGTWATIYGPGAPFRERHAPNSFKRSTDTAARGLPLLLFHDSKTFPIGRSANWDHAADALYGEWAINDSPEAQRAASAANDGELVGLSVGFLPTRAPQIDRVDDWDPERGPDHMDRVTHYESRLVEVSLTPTPAFTESEVLLVRSAFPPRERGESEVDRWKRAIESLRR